MKGLLVILLITTFGLNSVWGQNDFGISLKYRNGFLAAHRETMGHLVQEKISSMELSYIVALKDSLGWQKNFKDVHVGASLIYTSTGNAEVLGHAFGTLVFGELGLMKKGSWCLSSRIGGGLAYLTKVFDQDLNPKNMAISTHMNVLVLMGLQARYQKGQSLFYLGTDMTHFSNGAWKTPNFGLNLMMLSVGYGRMLGGKKALPQEFVKDLYEKWNFRINAIFGAKERFPTEGPRFPVFATYLSAQKYFGPKIGMEMGLDATYKEYARKFAPEASRHDMLQYGFFSGINFGFNRFSTVLGMGITFRDKILKEEMLYHRIGMRYQITDHLSASVVLRSNWGKADFTEWSLSYRFKRRER